MAESLSEVSSSMEGLEGTEEGKKKSKFKALKNFFGKKKKKELEDVMEGRGLKQRFSSSSLKPVLEVQVMEHKTMSSMGTKAISHDSVFCLDPEPEKSASKRLSSPEVQRSRSRKIPPLRSQKLSMSPSIIQSEKVSLDLDTASGKTPVSCKKMSTSHCTSTLKKVKAKQEEQHAAMETKEKATTKTKQADGKEKKRDSTGPPSQEQSNKTETHDKKTKDQALSTDAASSTGHSTSESHPRRRRRRAKNEWGVIEKSLLKSTQERDWGRKAESSPSEELAGREHSFLKIYLEKQGTEQTTTVMRTTPWEMSSDKRDVKGKMADRDVEARRAPASQPTYVAESRVSGPPPSHEEGSSEGKRKKDRAALLQWTRRSPTSQEEAAVSRTVEAQVQKRPSQVHGDEKETFKLGLQKFQPRMELSLESTTYHKERNPRGGLRIFSASVSSATTTDDVSMQMSPLPLRRWPNAETVSSDSKSTSEYESSSEMQLGPPHSFQLAWNPQDDDVFLKSENIDTELNKMERQQPLGYSSKSLGKSKAREVPSDLDSSSEDERSCEEMTSAQSSQSVEEYEECSESRSFIIESVSGEQLALSSHSQALQESEEKEVSTESSSSLDKFHSSEDMSSSEEEQPPERSKQVQGHSRDQQDVSSVLKSVPKESSVYANPVRPIHTSPPIVSPVTQQKQPILMNIAVGQRSLQPLRPSHTIKSWGNRQSEHQVFADPEGIAADWNIYMQPPSPRKVSKHPLGYNVEQNIPSSPDISTMGEVSSMEALLLGHHSQPPTRPVLEQRTCSGPEIAVFEECITAQPPRYTSQSSMRPSMKKEIPLGAESASFEGSHFLEPLPPVSTELLPPQHHSQTLLKPFIQHQVSAFERGVSMDPKLMAHSFQPWIKPPGKQSFSTPESTSFEGSPSMEHVPPTLPQPMQQSYQNVPLESEAAAAQIISLSPLHTQHSAQSLLNPESQLLSESTPVQGTTSGEPLPPQPSVKTKFQPQMTRDPVSTSTQWGSPMEPISSQHIFQTQASPKFKKVLTGPDSPEAQGSISMQPVSPRCSSQPWLSPTFEQMSVAPGNVPAAWATPVYPPAPRMPSQPSVAQQPVSTGSTNTSVQQTVSIEPMSPRHSLQPWPASPFEQVSVPADNDATPAWDIPIESPASRMLSQPLMGSTVQKPVSTELNISAPQSSTVELMPSRFPFQPRVNPESYGAEEGVSVMTRPGRHHSQTPISTGFKEDVSSDSARAPGEWGTPINPMPSKYAPESWLGPESEQHTSSLEGIAQEGDISKEAWLSRNSSQTVIKPQVQKTPSTPVESTSTEGGIPWKPLPPKASTPFLMRSKVQEMSSHLESAVAKDITKKAQDSRASSQSIVKFIAEQIFSESTASATDTYAKPRLRTRSRPSRSLLKPKLEEQTFLYNWDDEPKEDSTLKNLPTKQPSQSPVQPKEPKGDLSYSEGAPVKWGIASANVSQPLGKLEYRQKVSTSASFPEEWKRSEGHVPSTQPSQVFDTAGLQPPILSTVSANVEWSNPEKHQPPSQPTQAFLITDYQQQVYLSSANAAAEGTVAQKNPGSWPMHQNPDSPKKTMKYIQCYGDIIKSTSTSVTKPSKFTTVPAQKAFVSTGDYSTEEVPQSGDGDESPLSTSKADVENVFGVRLRRISQKIVVENPDPPVPVIPESKEWVNKEASQAISGGLEKFSQTLSFAEKQGNKSKYEGTFKKPAVYRPPGKTSSWKADCTAEPAWIHMAKQRQKSFASQFPIKPRTRTEIGTETKEPRHESKYDPDLEIPPKESEPITDALSRMTFSSTIARQDMSRLSKSTKSVAFDDQNVLHPYGRERETRRSSSLPPKFLQPEEPVWFSMAKKKAQAWSQIADSMQ